MKILSDLEDIRDLPIELLFASHNLIKDLSDLNVDRTVCILM